VGDFKSIKVIHHGLSTIDSVSVFPITQCIIEKRPVKHKSRLADVCCVVSVSVKIIILTGP